MAARGRPRDVLRGKVPVLGKVLRHVDAETAIHQRHMCTPFSHSRRLQNNHCAVAGVENLEKTNPGSRRVSGMLSVFNASEEMWVMLGQSVECRSADSALHCFSYNGMCLVEDKPSAHLANGPYWKPLLRSCGPVRRQRTVSAYIIQS